MPTPDDAPKREKGPLTLFKDAAEFAAEQEAVKRQAEEEAKAAERASTETRDARQDARTDHAWQLALDAANAGRKSAERTVKMLLFALAASVLAVIVLGAMVFDKKLGVTTSGIDVGESTEAIRP